MTFVFDDSAIGRHAEETIVVSEDMVESFARYSGDYNPLHLDAAYAARTSFRKKVAHGMSYGAVFSKLIGMLLPGPGALWMSQSFRFERPVFIGDTLTLRVEIEKVNASTRTLKLACAARNQQSETVLTGSGDVMIPETDDDLTEVVTDEQPGLALVVGAAGGIGSAIARKLAANGHDIALTYLTSRDAAETLATEIETTSAAFDFDLGNSAAAASLIQRVTARFGRPPSVLVLCASDRSIYGPTADGDFDNFQRHFQTQVGGTHALVSALLPSMIDLGDGTIIAIGTAVTETAPPPGMAAYLAAKSALQSYIQSLAVECGPQGIRANIVAPGMTETSLVASVPDRQKKVLAHQNPMRRLARPGDVAGAVAYLASSDARYVNGHTLLVSGGSVV